MISAKRSFRNLATSNTLLFSGIFQRNRYHSCSSEKGRWLLRKRVSGVLLLSLFMPLLSLPAAFGQTNFRIEIIAQTGDELEQIETIRSFGRGPSINDHGHVAFIARNEPVAEGIFVSDGEFATQYTVLTTTFSFGEVLQINNQGQVAVRSASFDGLISEILRIEPPPIDGRLVARNFFRNSFNPNLNRDSPFDSTLPRFPQDALFPWITLNNKVKKKSRVVFSATLKSSPTDTVLATPVDTEDGEITLMADFHLSPPIQDFPNLYPMVADNNTSVVRGPTHTSSLLLIPNEKLNQSIIVANTADFDAIGDKPGISDDGRVIAFMGDGSADGVGIYISIVGAAEDGRPIPSPPINAAGGENGFTAFSLLSRVGVNGIKLVHSSNKNVLSNYRIAFLANGPGDEPGKLGAVGLYVTDIDISEPADPKVHEPLLVLEAGTTIPGLAGEILDFDLYDPINRHGELAFWVRTTAGQAIVRAIRRQIILLDWENPVSTSWLKVRRQVVDPITNEPLKNPQTGEIIRSEGYAAVSPTRDQGENDSFFNSLPIVRDANFKAEVLKRVREIFARSGIDIPVDVYVGEPRRDDALYVRFAKALPEYRSVKARCWDRQIFLGGIAWDTHPNGSTANDKFNRRIGGEVAIFIREEDDINSAQEIAQKVAHEAAHGLGLSHINPFPNDPFEVMDYEKTGIFDDTEIFTDIPATILNPPIAFVDPEPNDGIECVEKKRDKNGEEIKHNPVYHLRRYVLGESHADLVNKGILPGSYDLSAAERFRQSLDEIAFDGLLFDLAVMIPDETAFGADAESATVLAIFETVDPQNLSEIEWAFRAGESLTMVASSSPAARWDLHFVFEPSSGFVVKPDILVPGSLQGSIIKISDTSGTVEVVGSFSTTIETAEPIGVSAGKTKMPVLIGQFLNDAELDIARAALVIGQISKETSTETPPDTILDQYPAPGALLPVGTAVELTVSVGFTAGDATIPNVVGLTQADAEAEFSIVGLTLGSITTQSSTAVAAGHVIGQTPKAGDNVERGSQVDLVISSGPALVIVPDVVGLSQSAAEAVIADAGLAVGEVTFENNQTTFKGLVISQNPTAGDNILDGNTIDLVVSLGTAAEFISIAISPTRPSVVPGTTIQFTATGTYSDGSSWDITEYVHWTSSGPDRVSVSNETGSKGFVTVLAAGTATITAIDAATGILGSSTLLDTAGYFLEMRNIRLNGSGSSIHVKPGSSVSLAAEYTMWSRSGCPSCIDWIAVGIEQDGQDGFYVGIPGRYPGRSGAANFSLAAPDAIGIYRVYAKLAPVYTEQDAINSYESAFPDQGNFIPLGTINVGINNAPELAPIANRELNAGGTLSVSVAAFDPDGDEMILSVSGLPSFGTFTDNGDGTGSIEFNPADVDAGIYPMSVTASDGQHSASVSFTLTVYTTDLPKDCRDILLNGDGVGDGSYVIDPDGPGGQDPINVECLMSLSDGGWTKLTNTISQTAINTDATISREYLYVKNGKWYRTPLSNLIWDWNSPKVLTGTYHYTGGSFYCGSSSEVTRYYGVSCSNGGGNQWKALIYYLTGKNPAEAQVQLCQDRPGIFGSACQTGVTVYIRSEGPVQGIVPDVIGLSQAAAEADIMNAGLAVASVSFENSLTIGVGLVISQMPEGGQSVEAGSAVDIVVSLGPPMVAVPEVTGLALSDAEAAITAAGLVVGNITHESNNTVPAGDVISQSPVAGTELAGGSAVDLVISTTLSITTDVGNGADSYIQSSAANTNFGSGASIWIKHDTGIPGNNRKGYLRFDLGAVSDNIVGASLTLRYVGRSGDAYANPSTYHVYGLKDGHAGENWVEANITWNNAPANNTRSAAGLITSAVTYLGAFNFYLTGSSPGELATFTSDALIDFLQNDTNGLVTLIIVRNQRNFSVEGFAAKEHSSLEAPTLRIATGSVAGACSFSDASCIIETEDNCISEGGTYHGGGTDCASYVDLDVSPDTIDFGEVTVGSSAYQSFTIANTGTAALVVSDVQSTEETFSIFPPTSFTIEPDGPVRTVSVGFAPDAAGDFAGVVSIISNAPNPVTINVIGRGTAAAEQGDIQTVDSLEFGSVAEETPAEQIITVTNAGSGPLTLSAAIADNDVFAVSAVAGDILPFTINPGGSRNLAVVFTPPNGSSGSTFNGVLAIFSDDPDQGTRRVALSGRAVDRTIPVDKNPVFSARVYFEPDVFDIINAATCPDVGGWVQLGAESSAADSFLVNLTDQRGESVSSSRFSAIDGPGTAAFSGIDACRLADGMVNVEVVYSKDGTELAPFFGTPAAKYSGILLPPVLNPVPPISFAPEIQICGTSRTHTTVRIEGGARAVSTFLDGSTTEFCLNVPLRPNTQNTLIASAIDEASPVPKPMAYARPLQVVQVDLSEIVIADVYSRPLTPAEIESLVDSGIIDLADPGNFNVSMFTVVFTIGAYPEPITISQPVVIGPTPGTVSYGHGGGWLVSGGSGGGTSSGGIINNAAQIVVITDENGQTIPGVIIIDGRIKTLKEFFQVTIALWNVSSGFTLSDMTASVNLPAGLTPIATGPGSDVPDVNLAGTVDTVLIGEIEPGDTGIGQFIIRGDAIGIYDINVDFDGFVTGGGLPQPIPVSGSAATSVQVLGPPELEVLLRFATNPSGPDVTYGDIFDLLVDITNVSDRPALYTSLELFAGGGAELVGLDGNPVPESKEIISFGHIQPGETVTAAFRLRSLSEGEIIACQAIAAQNITLSIDIGPQDAPCNIINSYPANFVPLPPDAAPVVIGVNPAGAQTNIPITTSVFAALTPRARCMTADTWANVVVDNIDPQDPGKGLQVVSADLVQTGTFYLEQLNAMGQPVRHIPVDLTVVDPPAGGTTIAVLRLGLDSPHANSQFFLSPNTTYRATLAGGSSGVCSAASDARMENSYIWTFTTGANADPNYGVCCLAGDSCTMSSELYCESIGGIYAGDGSDCSTGPCSYDSDGDGVPDIRDLCADTPLGADVDADGCADSQKDSDADGIPNDQDLCPGTPLGAPVDVNGCSAAQRDSDGDGLFDDKDLCPDTPVNAAVDANGCSAAQRDADGDGVADDLDLCPDTPAGAAVDINGCSAAQRDSDGDGVFDDGDLCPDTPAGTAVNAAGCPIGGCTLPDGSCVSATELECLNASDTPGDYLGDGAQCAATGACILPDGCCTETNEPACSGVGGTYQGDATRCAQDLVEVPDVIGMDEAEAYETIAAFCLVPETECAVTETPTPAGEVVSQNPPEGNLAAQGNVVLLGVSAGLSVIPTIVEGSSSGVFVDPQGPSGMIAEGVDTSSFVWGTPLPFSSASSLNFTANSFAAATEEEFTLGTLTYHNGTIEPQSDADTVDLEIAVNFSAPGSIVQTFVFNLALIDTPNISGTAPEKQADIVRLSSLYSRSVFIADGIAYTLRLTFGNIVSDEGGFTERQQFFVYEGQGASAELRAKITACNDLSPTGACLLSDGSCIPATEQDCLNAGDGRGQYQGDASQCPPEGACILPDGCCTEETEPECADDSGLYQGDNTECEEYPVEVPDVIGMAEGDARANIEALCLKAETECVVAEMSPPAGEVISQEPGSGGLVALNDVVLLGISSGVSAAPRPLEGRGTGIFENPTGPAGMVITGAGSNDFTWGSPAAFGTGPSSLTFEGKTFSAATEEKFLLGNLTFYNGTIEMGTDADTIDLAVTMELSSQGGITQRFVYTLELIDTPGTRNTRPEIQADIVNLTSLSPRPIFTIDGVAYTLELTFGNIIGNDGGFSERNRFFVYEGESASAELYGKITACVEPLAMIDDLYARAKSGKIDIVWSPIEGAAYYKIYRSTTQGGPYELIAGEHLSDYCVYADFGLTDGVAYYYVVRWVDAHGQESPDSNEAGATPTERRRRS